MPLLICRPVATTCHKKIITAHTMLLSGRQNTSVTRLSIGLPNRVTVNLLARHCCNRCNKGLRLASPRHKAGVCNHTTLKHGLKLHAQDAVPATLTLATCQLSTPPTRHVPSDTQSPRGDHNSHVTCHVRQCCKTIPAARAHMLASIKLSMHAAAANRKIFAIRTAKC
jgi:hypothetical protein